MHKIKFFFTWLSYLYISFKFRNKKVYVVNGLRRSGNHAFINWFVNALENQDVEFINLSQHLDLSKSKQTLFFNEANYLGDFWFVGQVRTHSLEIKQARNIIISLEDYIPNKFDSFIPGNSIKIAIRRTVINIISSRITRAISQAEIGLDRGDMAINHYFIKYLEWLNNKESNWLIWDFDFWVKDENNYNKNFLKNFGLTYDLKPKISNKGDGSSFTQQSLTPNASELANRWKMVELPKRVLELLNSNQHVLNDDEKEIIRSALNHE